MMLASDLTKQAFHNQQVAQVSTLRMRQSFTIRIVRSGHMKHPAGTLQELGWMAEGQAMSHCHVEERASDLSSPIWSWAPVSATER